MVIISNIGKMGNYLVGKYEAAKKTECGGLTIDMVCSKLLDNAMKPI